MRTKNNGNEHYKPKSWCGYRSLKCLNCAHTRSQIVENGLEVEEKLAFYAGHRHGKEFSDVKNKQTTAFVA